MQVLLFIPFSAFVIFIIISSLAHDVFIFLIVNFQFKFGMVREHGLCDTASWDFTEVCFLAFKRSIFNRRSIHALEECTVFSNQGQGLQISHI